MNATFLLPPSLGVMDTHRPSGLYRCGQLTALNVVTGNLSKLPFPIRRSTIIPLPPLQSAW